MINIRCKTKDCAFTRCETRAKEGIPNMISLHWLYVLPRDDINN